MRNVKIAQRGSALIVLIITMLIMGTLGTSMYLLTTTGTFGSLFSNKGNRAMFLAESGIRYAQKSGFSSTTLISYPLNSGTDSIEIIYNAATKNITSTGIADANSSWPVRRRLTYQPGTPGAPPPVPIGRDQLSSPGPNWGDVVDSTVDGGSAILVNPITENRDGGEDRVNVGYTGSFADSWTAAGGLSYDAQVKVKSNADYFLAGLAFRMDGGTTQNIPGYCNIDGCIQSLCTDWHTSGQDHCNSGHCTGTSYITTQAECRSSQWHNAITAGTILNSFYVSFMRSSDNGDPAYEERWTGNADSIPGELTNFVTTNDYYIVLWKEDPINSTIQAERIIAYKKLPADSGVFTSPFFSDDMENNINATSPWRASGDGSWARNSTSYSGTYSARGFLTNRNNTNYLKYNLPIAITSPTANLTFQYMVNNTGNVTASVETSTNGTTWTQLGSNLILHTSFSPATITITGTGGNDVGNIWVRFKFSTTDTNQDRYLYVDDVKIESENPFTPWSTLLVRLQEKTLTSTDNPAGNMPVGTRVNDIMVYYGTPTVNLPNNATGHASATDVYRTGSNPRDTVDSFDTANWPAGASGLVSTSTAAVSDPNFTLVQWDWVRSATANGVPTVPLPIQPPGVTGNWWYDTWIGTNDTIGTTAKFQTLQNNTIVRTTYNLTPSADGSSFGTSRQEVGLNAFGNEIVDNLWFDDFAVRMAGVGGTPSAGFYSY